MTKLKICSISGGGSMGAWAGGLLEKKGIDYDIVLGTSTGALLAPLVALGNYKKLKSAYTSVTNKDIFSYDPFTKSGSINYWKFIWKIVSRWLVNKTVYSIGESKNLLKTIRGFFSYEDYLLLHELKKEVIVTNHNVNSGKTEFVSSINCTLDLKGYEEFTTAMWVSAAVPLFMSTYEINNRLYVDGSVTEYLPVDYVIEKYSPEQIQSIDFVIHRHKDGIVSWKPTNIFSFIIKIITNLYDDIYLNDLKKFESYFKNNNIKIYEYYLPEEIKTINALSFNKKEMENWWDVGSKTNI